MNSAGTGAQKERAPAEYRVEKRDVERSPRHDKGKNIRDLAKQAETAAVQHNMTELYETARKISSRFKVPKHKIRDLSGVKGWNPWL